MLGIFFLIEHGDFLSAVGTFCHNNRVFITNNTKNITSAAALDLIQEMMLICKFIANFPEPLWPEAAKFMVSVGRYLISRIKYYKALNES